ncbi:MAG: hypothetical protein ACD_9C00242G0003, partial [uncultured bacterium]
MGKRTPCRVNAKIQAEIIIGVPSYSVQVVAFA